MSNLKHATQFLYAVVYLKQTAGLWNLLLYDLKSDRNGCWPSVRTLRDQGFATWVVKLEVTQGDDVGEALQERGIE